MVISLDDVDKRKLVDVKNEEGKKEKLPLYFDGESVSGTVSGGRERGVCTRDCGACCIRLYLVSVRAPVQFLWQEL